MRHLVVIFGSLLFNLQFNDNTKFAFSFCLSIKQGTAAGGKMIHNVYIDPGRCHSHRQWLPKSYFGVSNGTGWYPVKKNESLTSLPLFRNLSYITLHSEFHVAIPHTTQLNSAHIPEIKWIGICVLGGWVGQGGQEITSLKIKII